jgi:hypothetical protein
MMTPPQQTSSRNEDIFKKCIQQDPGELREHKSFTFADSNSSFKEGVQETGLFLPYEYKQAPDG